MENPCWTCAKACGGCAWSKNFEPVDGWIATFSDHTNELHPWSSYNIIFCPEYVSDGSDEMWQNKYGLQYDPEKLFKWFNEGKTDEEVRRLVKGGIPLATVKRYRAAWHMDKEAGEDGYSYSH